MGTTHTTDQQIRCILHKAKQDFKQQIIDIRANAKQNSNQPRKPSSDTAITNAVAALGHKLKHSSVRARAKSLYDRGRISGDLYFWQRPQQDTRDRGTSETKMPRGDPIIKYFRRAGNCFGVYYTVSYEGSDLDPGEYYLLYIGSATDNTLGYRQLAEDKADNCARRHTPGNVFETRVLTSGPGVDEALHMESVIFGVWSIVVWGIPEWHHKKTNNPKIPCNTLAHVDLDVALEYVKHLLDVGHGTTWKARYPGDEARDDRYFLTRLDKLVTALKNIQKRYKAGLLKGADRDAQNQIAVLYDEHIHLGTNEESPPKLPDDAAITLVLDKPGRLAINYIRCNNEEVARLLGKTELFDLREVPKDVGVKNHWKLHLK